MSDRRLRDLGIRIGSHAPGLHNAITDVPGVRVGHTTLVHDEPRVARTGVTVIFPRAEPVWTDFCFAGHHRFNGNGEMTGLPWLDEAGVLTTPIGLTNTHQVGLVRDVLVEYVRGRPGAADWIMPVVAETYDGYLNDIDAFHLRREHVLGALENARGGAVSEGGVGGGTGMRCHGFKGGIGTSSRVVQAAGAPYTVGALVQANYGRKKHLRVDGVPVGSLLEDEDERSAAEQTAAGEGRGSIIIVVGTDAPLIPIQCARLARRATVGLARVGGYGLNSSGDLFLAFATGNHVPAEATTPLELRMLPHAALDPLFEAAAEAVEEAILNALVAADTMTGFRGTVQALPVERMLELLRRAGRL